MDPAMKTVIAAIDLGATSARVLYHAAGFARLWSARLEVLNVSGEEPDFVRARRDAAALSQPAADRGHGSPATPYAGDA